MSPAPSRPWKYLGDDHDQSKEDLRWAFFDACDKQVGPQAALDLLADVGPATERYEKIHRDWNLRRLGDEEASTLLEEADHERRSAAGSRANRYRLSGDWIVTRVLDHLEVLYWMCESWPSLSATEDDPDTWTGYGPPYLLPRPDGKEAWWRTIVFRTTDADPNRHSGLAEWAPGIGLFAGGYPGLPGGYPPAPVYRTWLPLDKYERLVDAYTRRIMALDHSKGMRAPKWKANVEDHMRWLVRFQLPPGEEYWAIAHSVGKHRDSVRRYVKQMSGLIDLKLRPTRRRFAHRS